MPKKTKVFLDEFKGNPTMAIWEVDEQEEKIGKAPIIGFGTGKAIAITDHIEEIRTFVKVNTKHKIEKDL